MRLDMYRAAVITTALLFPSAAWAEMDAAGNAFMQQDFAKARAELDKETLERNPEGYILLGMMTRDGQGGVTDVPEAFFDITLGIMKSKPSFWDMGFQERRKAAAKMTPQQIISAERRAGEIGRAGLSDMALKQIMMTIRAELKACPSDCVSITDRVARFGPAAKDIIPDLEALMTRDEMWMPRSNYAYALGVIGTDAVPALERIALDRKQLEAEGPWNMQMAVTALGQMGSIAATARHTLLEVMTGDFENSKAQFNDLLSDLGDTSPEAMLMDTKMSAALALSQVGDPDHEVYARVIEYRDHGPDPAGRLIAAAAAAMTYGESDPLVKTMAKALQDGPPVAQDLAIRLLPGLLAEPATKSGGETLRPAIRKLAETTADPAIQKAARTALEDFAEETRWSAADALRDKNYKEAIERANASLDINPWSGGALRIRGIAKRGSGDIDGAISDFKLSMEVDGSAYQAQFILRDAGAMTEEQVSGQADDLTLKALETCLRSDVCSETMRTNN